VKPLVTMRAALSSPDLLGSVLAGPSWAAWQALLIAAMGERLTPEERSIFTRFTGRSMEPLQRVEELWGIIGRRGGKTRAASALAVYLAALCDYGDCLARGERGLVLFLAQNARQATIAFEHAAAIFDSVPMLSGEIVHRTADTLSLNNSIDLEVSSCILSRITWCNVCGDNRGRGFRLVQRRDW
jgi:hypothetical protein